MSTRLLENAAHGLTSLGLRDGEGGVRRISLEVEAEGRFETVLLSLREGSVQCVCSDGRNDGPHVAAALRFLGSADGEERTPSPMLSIPKGDAEARPQPSDLADALDDLLTAVTRVGVRGAQYAPSVDATLERLLEAAPSPTPHGLGRFIGRLRRELRSESSRRAARMLDGASRLVAALRAGSPTSDEQERIDAWLGVGAARKPQVELLYDRTMVEVGREWLSGAERASVERRYLIDIRSGVTYREDRPRNAIASLGPCPRELHVGLAEVEAGPAPQRIRVLQYEVEPSVRAETWQCLEQTASRSFAELTERYRTALSRDPALSEPFALIRPYRVELNGVFKAFDADGHQLLLDRSERRGAVLAFYELLDDGIEPAWLAGRLTDTGATVCLAPFALGTQDGHYIRL